MHIKQQVFFKDKYNEKIHIKCNRLKSSEVGKGMWLEKRGEIKWINKQNFKKGLELTNEDLCFEPRGTTDSALCN